MRLLPKISYGTQGFTIVELLVVFSVITIIAGIGFASFASYSDSQKLTESTRLLKTMIDDARQSAISQVLPEEAEEGAINCANIIQGYRINFCTNGTICSGANYELELLCGINQNVLRRRNFHNNVMYESATCESIIYASLTGEVSFIPATNTNCIVEVTNGKSTKTITVDRGGNVSLQ